MSEDKPLSPFKRIRRAQRTAARRKAEFLRGQEFLMKLAHNLAEALPDDFDEVSRKTFAELGLPSGLEDTCK